ncbi:MAG TPA: hypothetical protein VGU71_00335 [Candidatus Dormibacteraeota bacterium]|nr:hypothetical protein [Candidatus Dormibacteraeota bacterium]
MKLFLLRYDRRRGELLSIAELGGNDFAAANLELLKAETADPDLEVVLLQAESEEQLKQTHGRYFREYRDLADLAKTAV